MVSGAVVYLLSICRDLLHKNIPHEHTIAFTLTFATVHSKQHCRAWLFSSPAASNTPKPLLKLAASPICTVDASSCAELLPEDLPSLGQGSVHSAAWQGFFSSECVRKCAAAAVDIVSRSELPWVVIQVWGFAHSPVCWTGQKHCLGSVCGESDSHYSLILMPDSDVLCIRSLGEGDVNMMPAHENLSSLRCRMQLVYI